MLAVTANWLLTDGSLALARGAGADAWLHAIRRTVIRAGFRRNGRYEPVDSVSLVLAGDTFDWLLSDIWSGRERPWHGGPRSREARSRVVAASLRAARPMLAGLQRWLRRGIPVPGAEARGRPSARDLVHAKVHAVLLAGDRDAWAGEEFFAHDDTTRRFRVWVGDSWSDGDVTIRHGHDRDPVTYGVAGTTVPGCGRLPSLAESLTVDLVVPFAMALKAEPALWHLARPRLGGLAAAGLIDMPKAVGRLIGLWGLGTPVGRRVLMTWRRCVAAWTASAHRETPVTETEHDVVGPVANWLEASVVHRDLARPLAITRLALAGSDLEEPGTILGHRPVGGLRDPSGPWLMVLKPTSAIECLGQAVPERPVVTIGATGGQRIVEAA